MEKSTTALIVDDASTIRMIVNAALTDAGIQVMEADHGHQALILAQQQQFDIIFTDIHTPGMDGIELIKNLRQIEGYRFIPILALTTANTDYIKEVGKSAGATGWVNKPIYPQTIINLLIKLDILPNCGQLA